jgi:hypothetical protein
MNLLDMVQSIADGTCIAANLLGTAPDAFIPWAQYPTRCWPSTHFRTEPGKGHFYGRLLPFGPSLSSRPFLFLLRYNQRQVCPSPSAHL